MSNSYLGYARISSGGQSNFSLEGQREYLERRAVELGRPFRLFSEERSGTTQKGRDVFQDMLGIAKHGDIIGVAYTDRFGRGGAEDIILLNELYSRGIRVELGGQLFDPSSPERSFTDEMKLIVSKMYTKLQAHKSAEGVKKARESGRFRFKKNLFGFRWDESGTHPVISINVEEAHAVRRIFSLYQEGHSYPEIRDLITAEGLTARTGRKFFPAELRKILINPIYMGYYHPNPPTLVCKAVDRNAIKPEELVRALYYPAIIDPALWWEVYQGRRVLESKYPTRRRYQNRPFELTGLIACRECSEKGKVVRFIRGIKKTPTKGGDITHYPVYTSRVHEKSCPASPKTFKAEILENLFQCLVALVFEDPKESRGFVFEEIKKSLEASEEVTIQVVRLKKLIAEKDSLWRKLGVAIELSGDDNVTDLVSKRRRIRDEISELTDAIEKVQSPYQVDRRALEERLRSFSLARLRKFFAEETSGRMRRKIYFELITSAEQRDDELHVTFFNGRTFIIPVARAKGRNYQRFFVVESYYQGDGRRHFLVETSSSSRGFRASYLNENLELGEEVEHVELVKEDRFDEIQKRWDQSGLPDSDGVFLTFTGLSFPGNRAI